MTKYTIDVVKKLESGEYTIEKIGPSFNKYETYKQMFNGNGSGQCLKIGDDLAVEIVMLDNTKKIFYVSPFDQDTVLIYGDIEAWCEARNMLEGSEWYQFRIKPECLATA
jgi:hypothetical protein